MVIQSISAQLCQSYFIHTQIEADDIMTRMVITPTPKPIGSTEMKPQKKGFEANRALLADPTEAVLNSSRRSSSAH